MTLLLWQRGGGVHPVDVTDDVIASVVGGSDVAAGGRRRRRGGYVGVQSRFAAHLADDVRQRLDVVLGERQRLDLGCLLYTSPSPRD